MKERIFFKNSLKIQVETKKKTDSSCRKPLSSSETNFALKRTEILCIPMSHSCCHSYISNKNCRDDLMISMSKV
jgi:hypothetical protein